MLVNVVACQMWYDHKLNINFSDFHLSRIAPRQAAVTRGKCGYRLAIHLLLLVSVIEWGSPYAKNDAWLHSAQNPFMDRPTPIRDALSIRQVFAVWTARKDQVRGTYAPRF